MGRVWQSDSRCGSPTSPETLAHSGRLLGLIAGIRGGFVFPVRSERKVIGVFGFNSRQVRETDEGLLKAILVIGSQIGQFWSASARKKSSAGSAPRWTLPRT